MMRNAFWFTLLCLAAAVVTAGCQQWPNRSHNSPAISKIKDSLGIQPGRDSYCTEPHPIYDVARSITRFEDQLRRDGTITVKSPDVWTDSSLMHSIQEFDGLMEESVKGFEETLQAYVADSIREGLESETSVGAGLDAEGNAIAAPALTASNSIITNAESNLFSALQATKDLVSDDVKFKLEPTQLERQRATFINVNQSLRRKKLGGDNIRMPGYGLYLFRVPVSVLPGVETSQGYAAVVNMRAKMMVTASDVKYAIPRMAIAQLVDRLAFPVHDYWTKQANVAIQTYSIGSLKRARVFLQDEAPVVDGSQWGQSQQRFGGRSREMSSMIGGLGESATVVQEGAQADGNFETMSIGPIDEPAALVEQQWAPPLPVENMVHSAMPSPIAGTATIVSKPGDGSSTNEKDAITAIKANAKYSDEDIINVYRYMKAKIGTKAPPKMHELRQKMLGEFLQMSIHMEKLQAFDIPVTTDRGQFVAIQCAAQYLEVGKPTQDIQNQWIAELSNLGNHFSATYRNTAWLVARQCGLTDLNIKRLIDDMVLQGRLDQQTADEARSINFLSEHDLARATEIWRKLLEKKFPLQVFTIEPAAEEQNLLDSQSRLRQLQVALAASIANGSWNARQRVQMAKEIARDSAAIGLNRTNVGFVHGMDTFGWYFNPRIQSPERRAAAFSTIRNAIHPETKAEDAKTYRLEPGMRECEVLIAMPSFISRVKFDITTNWESLSEPGVTKRSYEELIGEGCQLQKLKQCLSDQNCVGECREGDISRLESRIEQLEQMLGLQTYKVGVPFDYEVSSGQLFSRGEESLRPELYGFHGLHLLVPPQAGAKEGETKEFTAEFFLSGRNFHPTLTHVVVGGHEVHSMGNDADVEILSRELVRVRVKIETDKMNEDGKFEARVGTPSGMSEPLMISRYEEKEAKKEDPPKSNFNWAAAPSVEIALFAPKTGAEEAQWRLVTPAADRKNLKIEMGPDNPMSEVRFKASTFSLQMAYEAKFSGSDTAKTFKGKHGVVMKNPDSIDYDTVVSQVIQDISENIEPTESREVKVKVTTWFVVDEWPMEKMDATFEVTVTPQKSN